MTKALELFMERVFEAGVFETLEAELYPRNVASRRVLEKNGFVSIGLSPGGLPLFWLRCP